MAARRTPSNTVSRSGSASSLHGLREKITCRACKKQYDNPKTLPCLHSFCLSCLASLQLSDLAMKKLVCPECQKTIVVESDSLSSFPDAFLIQRQISEFEFLRKVHGVVDTKCEKCTGKPVKATSFCDGCGKFVCDLCVTIHRSWSEFSSHKILTLSDLKECYHKYIPNSVTPTSCIQHEKECTVYCETCAREICHECIIKSHRDHQYNLTAESAKVHKMSTREKLLMIDTVPDELDSAISKLEKLAQNIKREGGAVKSTIDARFQEVELAVTKRQKALIVETTNLVEAKCKVLEEQRQELVQIRDKVTSCKDFVNQTINSDNNSHFFVLKKQMCDRIAEVSKEFTATELTSVEEPSVKFSIDYSLRGQLSKSGSVGDGSFLHVGYGSLTNGVFSPIWPSQFFVNEVVTFYIALSASYFKIRSNPAEEITAEIHCLRDNSICPSTVAINSNGFAKIQCSFAERGRYVFMVKISGHHVSGSPHPFFVRPSPTSQFHAPIRSISKLTTPKGLAVNRKNQIIISQEDLHNVTVFGRRCRKVLSFGSTGSGEAQFNRPNGVSTDKSNCIYVSDTKNHRVQKFDCDGNFVKEFTGEEDSSCGPLKQPTGIHVAANEDIFVVDRGNGRVVIISTDLEYKHAFGSLGKGKGQFEDPWDVCVDANGLVYVTDVKIHSVLIFDPSGEYRGQIGAQGSQKSRLNRPSGIAIDKFGRIFVCEFGNHRVSVFHVSSEFIDCFSTGLSMVNPHSIALDEDGYIYVSSAEAVHVF